MTVTREDKTNSTAVALFAPAVVTESKLAIPALSLSGWDSVMFVATIGASGDELGEARFIEIELMESNNNADGAQFKSCSNDAVLNAVAGTNSGTIAKLQAVPAGGAIVQAAYIGHCTFVRPVIRLTGEHQNGTIIGIQAVLRGAKYRPVKG